MAKFQIEKSININATAEQTRRAIQDYSVWDIWSPWLCMEPTTKLQMEGQAAQAGHAYSWQGDMIGAGRMELARIDGDTDHMDLTFFKPFKSTAKVRFTTRAMDHNTTRVTWHMDSSLPFFMFFMINTMKAMIGMDYERGLKLLKEYVETGSVTSATNIVGVVDVTAINYIGVSAQCQMAEITDSMQSSFDKLTESSQGRTTESYRGSVYHKLNIKTQQCRYTAFAPVAATDANGTIAGCRALKVVHTGSYHHLGNGWATANTYQRHKKLKKHKQIAPFELYTNDPATVPQKNLITEIYIPLVA